jgi:hypothetical protein
MKLKTKIRMAAIVALCMGLLGLSLIRHGLAVRTLLETQTALRQDGLRVDGEVTQVAEVPGTQDGLGGAMYDLTYSYTVTEAEHQGTVRFPRKPGYAPGDAVVVWVDPESPTRQTADLPGSTAGRTPRQMWVLFIAGVASILAGLGFFYFEVQKSRPQAAVPTEPETEVPQDET